MLVNIVDNDFVNGDIFKVFEGLLWLKNNNDELIDDGDMIWECDVMRNLGVLLIF